MPNTELYFGIQNVLTIIGLCAAGLIILFYLILMLYIWWKNHK